MRNNPLVSSLILAFITPLIAQAAGPSSDWTGAWEFPSVSSKNNVLLQADLIKRAEEDYYSNIGRTTVNYNVTYDSSRNVNCSEGSTCDSIDLSNNETNAIGAQVINSTEINGNNNSVINQDNYADSVGNQSADISAALAGGVIATGDNPSIDITIGGNNDDSDDRDRRGRRDRDDDHR